MYFKQKKSFVLTIYQSKYFLWLTIFNLVCDVFDQHDTEECPVQSSESSPMHTVTGSSSQPINNGKNPDGTKKRVLPPPRKYCEVCEGKKAI